jgi:hypothetical protein
MARHDHLVISRSTSEIIAFILRSQQIAPSIPKFILDYITMHNGYPWLRLQFICFCLRRCECDRVFKWWIVIHRLEADRGRFRRRSVVRCARLKFTLARFKWNLSHTMHELHPERYKSDCSYLFSKDHASFSKTWLYPSVVDLKAGEQNFVLFT